MIDPIDIPYSLGGHLVPGYWQFLLPEEAKAFRFPEERRATCDKCPMARFQGHDALYRCCAYHPQVPNYLLGLAAREPRGRAAVENLERIGLLLPDGFIRSPVQWIDYLADLHDDRFDSSTRVKCPLLEVPSGLCQIYAFRNAVCSTFFCFNDHGDAGDRFWVAIEEMVSYAELALGQWALGRCGFDVAAYYRRLDSLAPTIAEVSDPKTRSWKPKILEFLWGEFNDRKLTLFTECAEEISRNRDRLWEIARAQTTLEASKFENAGVGLVPKALKEEIDPADLEDTSSSSMSLEELWNEVLDEYGELWAVPDLLGLSPRALLAPNPKNDPESEGHSHLPFVAIYLKRKGGKTPEWRRFLKESEYNALRSLRKRRAVDSALLKSMRAPDLPDPRAFLAEWSGTGFLKR